MNFPDLQLGKVLEEGPWRRFQEGIYRPLAKAVIVEIVSTKAGAPPEEIEFFKERARLLKSIDQPNISRLLAHGEMDGEVYSAVEKETQERLVDHLGAGEFLPPAQATGLILDVARALSAIHEVGRVHGELSPSNILFYEGGQLKLKNVFRFRQEKDYILKLLARRPEYLSPEHLRMETLGITSDHYVLGVLYFQLLTGRPPYDGVEPQDIWRLHLEGDLPTLPSDLASIEGLEGLLQKMLAKRPKYRHASDAELIADLESVEDLLMVMDEEGGEVLDEEPPVQEGSARPRSKKLGLGAVDKKGGRRKNKAQAKAPAKKTKARQWQKASPKLATKAVGSTTAKARDDQKVVPKKKNNLGLYGMYAGAALAIGGIVTYWSTQGIDPDERYGLDEAQVENAPKRVIKTLRELEFERTGVMPPLKKEPSPKKKIVYVDVEGNPIDPALLTDEPVEAEPVVNPRILELKALAQLPKKEALPQLEAALEDEDPRVRSVAQQLYSDLQGTVSNMDQSTATGEELRALAQKIIEGGNRSAILSLVDSLARREDEVIPSLLKMTLNLPNVEIQAASLRAMKQGAHSDYRVELGRALVDHPNERALLDLARGEDDAFFQKLEEGAVLEAEPNVRVALLPLWVERKDVATIRQWMVTDPACAWACALSLSSLGELGQKSLLEVLASGPDEALTGLILSALRMTDMNASTVESLSQLRPNLTQEQQRTVGAMLASKGLEVNGDSLTLWMMMDDSKGEPSDEALALWVSKLGDVDPILQDRLFVALERWPQRAAPMLREALNEKVDDSLREQICRSLVLEGSEESLRVAIENWKALSTKNAFKAQLLNLLLEAKAALLPALRTSSLDLPTKTMIAYRAAPKALGQEILPWYEAASALDARKTLDWLLDQGEGGALLVDAILLGSKDPTSLKIILKALTKRGDRIGLQGTLHHLSNEDRRIRTEALGSLKDRFLPQDQIWTEVYRRSTQDDVRGAVLGIIEKDQPNFDDLISQAIGDEAESLRKSAIQAMERSGKGVNTPEVLNRLILEPKASLKNSLVNHLLSNMGKAHPVVLIWSQAKLSASARNKIALALATRGAEAEERKTWAGFLNQAYHMELKLLLAEYLIKSGVALVPQFYRALDMNQKESLELFQKAVEWEGARAVPQLLKWLGETKNPLIRDELQKALKMMKIEYRLDPVSGRYIVL